MSVNKSELYNFVPMTIEDLDIYTALRLSHINSHGREKYLEIVFYIIMILILFF